MRVYERLNRSSQILNTIVHFLLCGPFVLTLFFANFVKRLDKVRLSPVFHSTYNGSMLNTTLQISLLCRNQYLVVFLVLSHYGWCFPILPSVFHFPRCFKFLCRSPFCSIFFIFLRVSSFGWNSQDYE